LDADPVLLRRSVFLAGGRTWGCKAIGGVVGRSNPTEPLRTEIADANFKLGSAAQFRKLQSSSEKHFRLWPISSDIAVQANVGFRGQN
jgi:hypothetical protein